MVINVMAGWELSIMLEASRCRPGYLLFGQSLMPWYSSCHPFLFKGGCEHHSTGPFNGPLIGGFFWLFALAIAPFKLRKGLNVAGEHQVS